MSELITIKTYNNRMEAESDKGLLKHQDIKSIVSSDDCGGVNPSLTFTSGVKLLIKEEDTKKARQILQINNE